MAYAAHHRFTFDEYLRIEDDSRTKHEFFAGQVFAMSGGSPDHARVIANLARLLGNALAGKQCAVYSSELRIRVKATGLGTYPDIAVVCGPLELDDEDPKGHTVVNPLLLVEVLSPSTEDYDRGDKLGSYKLLPSLAEVVLVAHDRREIEVVRREDDGTWSRWVVHEGEEVTLRSVAASLAVEDVYFDPLATAP